MYKNPNLSNNQSFIDHQSNNAIINYFVIGIISFGLLFVEQPVLKFFVFPASIARSLITLRGYSLVIYILIIIELVRRIRKDIKIGSSFNYLALIYMAYFLSYIYNTPFSSFYAFATNFIFSSSLGILICIICYLYCSKELIKLSSLPLFYIMFNKPIFSLTLHSN